MNFLDCLNVSEIQTDCCYSYLRGSRYPWQLSIPAAVAMANPMIFHRCRRNCWFVRVFLWMAILGHGLTRYYRRHVLMASLLFGGRRMDCRWSVVVVTAIPWIYGWDCWLGAPANLNQNHRGLCDAKGNQTSGDWRRDRLILWRGGTGSQMLAVLSWNRRQLSCSCA